MAILRILKYQAINFNFYSTVKLVTTPQNLCSSFYYLCYVLHSIFKKIWDLWEDQLKILFSGYELVLLPPLRNRFSQHLFQFSSVTDSCPALCEPMNCSTPGLPVYHQLPEFTQTHVHLVGDAIQPSHPLSSPLPPAPNPSQHQSFSNESVLHMRWPKYWSFTFSIIPSKEHPGPISLRMDWLDFLAVQGTLKSLLQHHSSKAWILRSAFFTIQLSHPYMTTGKTIALARWTFVGKVMSLFFNMLSSLVITFLPRSKRLLISWHSITICSDFGAPKYKVCHCFHCFPIYFPWSDGTRFHDLHFLNVAL